MISINLSRICSRGIICSYSHYCMEGLIHMAEKKTQSHSPTVSNEHCKCIVLKQFSSVLMKSLNVFISVLKGRHYALCQKVLSHIFPHNPCFLFPTTVNLSFVVMGLASFYLQWLDCQDLAHLYQTFFQLCLLWGKHSASVT